jgi:hypothetical protein
VLIAVYAIFALSATARAAVQIAAKFSEAPVAYLLSALAGVVYILATIGLAGHGPGARRLAWAAVGFELLGVLTVGTLTVLDTGDFPDDTVWSVYGRGTGSSRSCSRSSASGGCAEPARVTVPHEADRPRLLGQRPQPGLARVRLSRRGR